MGWTDGMTWMNPPTHSAEEEGILHVRTGDRQDFWRRTFYGFVHDDGHALLTPTSGAFSTEVTFEGAYQAQYDQAGLMLRVDESVWIKAGVEYVGGRRWLAVVVTRGRSDWSQLPLSAAAGPVRLRLTRKGDAVWVQYRVEDDWVMARLAHLPADLPVLAGPMCCSPSREGFEVRFWDFRLGSPVSEQPY